MLPLRLIFPLKQVSRPGLPVTSRYLFWLDQTHQQTLSFSSHPPHNPLLDSFTQKEIEEARQWLTDLSRTHIPTHHFDVSYARASGPGGQHVNKVSTKATVRLPAHHWGRAATWIHPVIRHILFSPQSTVANTTNDHAYSAIAAAAHKPFPYQVASGDLVIQSDRTRSRDENRNDCFDKLVAAIKDHAYIPPETKQHDLDRWEKIHGRAKESRLREKKMHSQKKTSRKHRGDD
ncbi:uncharacterized protein SAPINGB_P000334 [Magnusiomyces paraingens]|uniref:Prokaryotic-type class I peptide chain release factors domain-containing protein n=1 Tax=Magnusiomyces paraingens TaxID=2606893 RepID=A0A5E8B5L8_9ASCO|nr:uncharacterized protein SAPINGB_P000334 [Saprochaete ingens]VVT44191.1 unnamed protein product [Saprochaete ingens]